MKKLLILTSFVALVMAGCKNTGENGQTASSEDGGPAREVSSQIAYIKLDTLMNHFDMYIELSAEFEKKAQQMENDMTSRTNSFQRAVTDAQTQIERGLVTRAQAEELQADLQRREQSLYQYSETRQAELIEENQVIMNKILFAMEEFIAEFNNDYRYSMILTSTGGSPILHADPALDITDLVIKGLNEKYAKDKAAGK